MGVVMSDINYNTATLEELKAENKKLNNEVLRQRLIAENKKLKEVLELMNSNTLGVTTLYNPLDYLIRKIPMSSYTGEEIK